MLKWKAGLANKSWLRVKPLMVFVVGLFVFIGSVPSVTLSLNLSEQHEINIDPASRQKIGEKAWGEIKQFFTDAETAIETENLNDLLALYSDRYSNGDHVKDSAKVIWTRIFSRFNNMVTIHHMRFITASPKNDVMTIRCNGILAGVPEGSKDRITIDNWVNSDHILKKENGKWKLIGSTGKERKRLWFDKPMHPLF